MMGFMQLIYSGLIVLLASACTAQSPQGSSTASEQDARRVFQVASAAIKNAENSAPQGVVAPVTANIDFNAPCATSGSLSIAGSFEGNDTGTDSSFDLSASFDACADVGGVLDGDLHWKSDQVGDSYTASLDGSLTVESGGVTATCVFDLSVEVTPTSQSFSGSVCGFDPDELDIDTDDFQI
jgi:hypothetical protein